jgi:gliding motility-associated-like protein
MSGSIAKTIITFFLLFISLTLNAQLNAEFSITNGQGCVPLKTSFSNLSTGVSANTVYSWNFGNGNLSSLKDPSAVFLTEGSYTVTLTVKDGNQTSTKTREVKVYKKPQADFTFSSVKGCSPLTVTFTSTSTAGDGIINSYFWDFGDGSTQQTYSPATTHTYQIKQKASVSLTVVNQYGCYNTIVKNDIIDVLDPLGADFSVDQTILCKISDEVKFTNKSAGPGTLSYLWDFGDGTTSTEKDPKHIFTQKGIYTIKLTVTSSEGCAVTKTLSNHVNVATYKADFNIASSEICLGTPVQITTLSTPSPSQTIWQMGDGNSAYYTYNFSHWYYNKGDYQIKLINSFGACKDSITKTVKVKQTPVVSGFLDTLVDKCGAPARMKFKDTTTGAVGWEWSFMYDFYNPVINSTVQEPVFTYPANITYNVRLKVTNAEGCSAVTTKYVTVTRPYVAIEYTSSTAGGTNSCTPFTVKFKAQTQETITSYKWNFPGGITSTDATPEFTFSTVGTHTVSLNYTTASGCNATAVYNNINLYPKPVANFVSRNGTDICGNTLVHFDNLSTGELFRGSWYVNGTWTYGESFDLSNTDLYYRFTNTGKYTIRFVATNGICNDTMTKVDYINIKPPFVKINGYQKGCEGNGGQVTFADATTEATGWLWEFGDGQTATYTTYQSNITHQYSTSGIYKVRLSATNGSCTVRDSVMVTVMLRQKIQLAVNNPSLCSNENLGYSVSGLQASPAGNYTYSFYRIEYGDGSPFNGYNSYYYINQNPFSGSLGSVDPSQDKLRFILYNSTSGCFDTTNYISYAVKGAKPSFVIEGGDQCYQLPVTFKDKSTVTGNNSIVSWEWNFGDGVTKTTTTAGDVTHIYTNPGSYYVTLKIRDAAGCTTTSAYYDGYVSVKGPKASFYASGTNVPLNTNVYFYNNTNNYNVYNTQYSWDFGNGVTSTQYSPSYTFTVAGTYNVKLIAKDPLTGCTSEATQVIVVRDFNSAFNFNTSFVGNASCPPVMARFNNTSAGAVRVKWDFGDGTTADNVNYPSHIYTKAGTYIVTLYVYGYNGLTGTYTDSVKVKGLDAAIKFDPKETCSSQPVNFNASATGVTNYVWDFGDGQLFSSTDSTAVHSYRGPGVYKPSLLITNTDGCTVAAASTEKITIDSLSAKIKGIPLQACNQAKINFNAEVYSVGASQNQNFLSYKWNFGTGNAADTANTANPVFQYNTPGTYTVTLRVTARSGCVKDVSEIVVVKESSKGTITAPAAICAGETATFTSAATITNGVQWSWDFKNGQTATIQNPSAQTYVTAGSYPVTLVVNNQGCLDTATHMLIVNALPVVQLSPTQPKVCVGNSIQLAATGGTAYQWSPAAGLSDAQIANPFASPANTTNYRVVVTNQYGCKKTDSITVRVVQPISISGNTNYSICEGEFAQLTVTGALSYKWINNTQGLGSTSSASTTASPATTTTYTVVGYDAENCFTDTLDVNVVVHPKPTVNAGPDMQSLPGNTVQLNATGSNNISTWMWRPPDFLSCVQCPSPVSSTNRTITYIIEAKTDKNCSASDSVTIEILCNGSQIFIPNSFTPNGDGKNDYFSVLGNGASLIKLFVIYDRWGNKVFERSNLTVDDPKAKWDGNYKGYPAPIGSFTYSIQLTCDATGESFVRSGSVTILR